MMCETVGVLCRVRMRDTRSEGVVEESARGRSGLSRTRRFFRCGVEASDVMAVVRVLRRWARSRDVRA